VRPARFLPSGAGQPAHQPGKSLPQDGCIPTELKTLAADLKNLLLDGPMDSLRPPRQITVPSWDHPQGTRLDNERRSPSWGGASPNPHIPILTARLAGRSHKPAKFRPGVAQAKEAQQNRARNRHEVELVLRNAPVQLVGLDDTDVAYALAVPFATNGHGRIG